MTPVISRNRSRGTVTSNRRSGSSREAPNVSGGAVRCNRWLSDREQHSQESALPRLLDADDGIHARTNPNERPPRSQPCDLVIRVTRFTKLTSRDERVLAFGDLLDRFHKVHAGTLETG